MVHDKSHPREGSLVIDAKKYQYQLQDENVPELVIFEGDLNNKLVNCSIPTQQSTSQINTSKNAQAVNNNCYVLGLCYYLFLPQAIENVVKFASA